jgi:HK97 family phage major capsid protein
LLNQDAIGIEQMIRQDIVNAINSKLEATILGAAAGSSTQPKGIFNGVTYTTVGDMEDIAGLEATVEAANVLGECKYILAPSAKAALRAKAKGENVAESLYNNGEIDGTKALSTSHVAANKLVYGDFSNLAIGQWGPIDLTVDNYTQAVNGCVRLVINAYFDAAVLRSEAFAFGQTAE